MLYRRAIVDELGCIMYWCSDLTDEEIDEILIYHPEWSIKCIAV